MAGGLAFLTLRFLPPIQGQGSDVAYLLRGVWALFFVAIIFLVGGCYGATRAPRDFHDEDE